MGFEDKLMSKYIKPALSEKGYGDLAIVMEINPKKNTVNIMIENAEHPTLGEMRMNVDIPYTPGVESISLYPGDKVWVQYRNGDRSLPFITAIYPHGSQYQRHKQMKALHTRNLLT